MIKNIIYLLNHPIQLKENLGKRIEFLVQLPKKREKLETRIK